jgi:SIR2-like domain
MVLTESDYEERLSFNSAMDLRLFSDLLNRTVLFIGYSFRDPNVAYLFRRINSWFDKLPHSESGRRAYIIVSEPSDFERRLFRARNIEVISVGPNLTSAVAGLLEEIRG